LQRTSRAQDLIQAKARALEKRLPENGFGPKFDVVPMTNAYNIDCFLLLQRDNDICSAFTNMRAADALKARFQDLEIKVRIPLDVTGVVVHDERKVNSRCCSALQWTIQKAKEIVAKWDLPALPAFKQGFSPAGLEFLYAKQAPDATVSHQSVVIPPDSREHTSVITDLGRAKLLYHPEVIPHAAAVTFLNY